MISIILYDLSSKLSHLSLRVSAETILKIQHLKIKVQPLENDILCIDFLKAIKFIIGITSSFIANSSAYMCTNGDWLYKMYGHSATRFVRIRFLGNSIG